MIRSQHGNLLRLFVMSALGHDQTSRNVRVMPVIPLEADIRQRGLHVRLVPIADIRLGPIRPVDKSQGGIPPATLMDS